MNRNFKILKIDHIAFATKSIDRTKNFFIDILGLENTPLEHIENENVKVLKLFANNSDTKIELIEPLNDKSTIEKFLKKNGNSLHHIALTVDNINNAIMYLLNSNVDLIYEEPQLGSDNKLITFIHPKITPGLLIELCQKIK